jgi:DNA-binding transcriptional MerR regulator
MAKDKSDISVLSFGVRVAAERHGLTVRQLNWYIKRGYVTPSVRPPSGRGPSRARLFGPADLKDIAVIAVLRRAGIHPRRSGQILELMRAHGIVIPRDGVLVGNDRKVWLVEDATRAYDVLRQLQGAFALFLDVETQPAVRRADRARRAPRWKPDYQSITRRRSRTA